MADEPSTKDQSGLRSLWDREVRFYDFRLKLPDNWKDNQTLVAGPTETQIMVVGPPDYPGTVDDANAFIASCQEAAARRGLPVEWRTWSHDLPSDLPGRLVAAGFEARPSESLVIGVAHDVAANVRHLPDGFAERALSADEDIDPIVAFLAGNDADSDLDVDTLASLVREGLSEVHIVEHGDDLVATSWLTRKVGTGFTYLGGACTRERDQNRGIQKYLIVERAKSALGNSEYLYSEVAPSSPQSEKNLRDLGFRFATNATTYLWTPLA